MDAILSHLGCRIARCLFKFEMNNSTRWFLFPLRYRFFPNEQTGISGFGSAPIPRRQPEAENNGANRARQAFGGRGHVLGNN